MPMNERIHSKDVHINNKTLEINKFYTLTIRQFIYEGNNSFLLLF